ncbi:hypothetical protein LCM00_08160 [Bacillus infantis]|jgi:uncharacterized membrane protein YdfJ with MMPL/SSD domain|uniref:hypothetical protein n=1 Tax=Bacillus infantis TaxID=324767 RepID=UPI001CD4353A|nr:hypothetical protein [Bacillus infantis]MCA1039466.1 hypothetical protein [Bacillus infantis]MCR6610011.1 hypothetical protein [Bacillus infantis]
MSGAWILIILIVVLIAITYAVQAFGKHSSHPVLTQKEVLEAIKKREDEEAAGKNPDR